MSLSYDVNLIAAAGGTYFNIEPNPKPAVVGTLSAVYTLNGNTVATSDSSFFSLTATGIRWSIPGSVNILANSGMTYAIKDGSTTIASGTVRIVAPPSASSRAATGSTAMSYKKAAQVYLGAPAGLTVSRLTAHTDIDLTAGIIYKGEDYWGVPGTALDLDITVSEAAINFPLNGDDREYNVSAVVRLFINAADAGKHAHLFYQGNAIQTDATFESEAGSSTIFSAHLSTLDTVFLGDNTSVRFSVMLSGFANDATVDQAVIVIQEV